MFTAVNLEDLEVLIRKVQEQGDKMGRQLIMKKTEVITTGKTTTLPLMEKMWRWWTALASSDQLLTTENPPFEKYDRLALS